MLILKGKYTQATVYTDMIDEESINQIISICNHPAFKDDIKIMPDVHKGEGCVIGFTAPLGTMAVPNLVGVDIGCGVISYKLGRIDIDFEKFYNFICEKIPCGQSVNSKVVVNIPRTLVEKILQIAKKTDTDADRHLRSISSLGGGNHFIEIAEDSEENKWLLIHSGSRNFGKIICQYHQKIAQESLKEIQAQIINTMNKTIGLLRQRNELELIQKEKQRFEKELEGLRVPRGQEYLSGELLDDYLNDMRTAQEFAELNRRSLGNTLLRYLDATPELFFDTVHNYIDDDNIVRKGAVAAHLDKQLVIPINMAFGSILAKGKGNKDWNYSAPHGAGRLLSRKKAKEIISMEEFLKDMKKVCSFSISEATIDEAPGVYKPPEEIISKISDTVSVVDILKSVYNFKSSS